MKTPSSSDATLCLTLRKQSKQGHTLSKEDHDFCAKMWKKYPKWYKETSKEVFDDTVPYGSNVRL